MPMSPSSRGLYDSVPELEEDKTLEKVEGYNIIPEGNQDQYQQLELSSNYVAMDMKPKKKTGGDDKKKKVLHQYGSSSPENEKKQMLHQYNQQTTTQYTPAPSYPNTNVEMKDPY